MHTAVKVMLILGTLTTVGGIILMAVGTSAIVDYDPIVDSDWNGSSGTFNDDLSLYYSVYSTNSSCDSITYSITDVDGDSAISQYECDDSMFDVNGYIYLGQLSYVGPYTIDSSETIYISNDGSDAGVLAFIASWGAICCGVFMLILGGIFALTITEPKVVVINQGGMPMQQGQMMAAQYPQPVQQQYAQQPVQQQPVQQNPFDQPPVQQQPVQENPFGQPPVQQSPFDQQPPQGGF